MSVRPYRAGFTLMELMVALAVLAMISVFTFQTLGGTLNARDHLSFDDELEKSARTTLGRIRREVSLAFLTPSLTAVNSYRTVFVGKDDGETDQLWFATRSHRRTLADLRESDQTESRCGVTTTLSIAVDTSCCTERPSASTTCPTKTARSCHSPATCRA